MASLNTTTVGPDEDDEPGVQPVNPYEDQLLRLRAFVKYIRIDPDFFFDYIIITFRMTCPLLLCTSFFGIVSNLLNLIAFKRQGIRSDSSTVSLAALALSDLILCSTSFLDGSTTLLLIAADRSDDSTWFESFNRHRIKTGPSAYVRFFAFILNEPGFSLSEFNAWVTAYLTIERTVSVTFPFRVKTLFTPKRSLGLIVGFFLMCVGFRIPPLLARYVIWEEIAGIVRPLIAQKDDYTETVNIFGFIEKTILRTVYISIIIICNAIIVIQVNTSKRFRKSMSLSSSAPTPTNTNTNNDSNSKSKETSTTKPEIKSTPKDKNVSIFSKKKTSENPAKDAGASNSKEVRLIRIMYLLSITFLVSRIPNAISFAIYKIQESISDRYRSAGFRYTMYFYHTFYMIGRFLVILNAATNVFIYYALSTKYREIVGKLFSSCCKKCIVKKGVKRGK